MTEVYRDDAKNWHISKGVSVTTIMAVIAMVVTTSYQIGTLETQLRADQRSTVAMIDATNLRLDAMTQDRIHKTTVDQMFQNRDLQIEQLEERLERLDNRLKESNAMLKEILEKVK